MKLPATVDVLRPGQWVKNTLVFASAFFAVADKHQTVTPLRAGAAAFAAFVLFCLVSGAVYIVNDVHDAEADRLHPEKRNRPVASGRLGRRAALSEAAGLAAFSLAAAAALGRSFAVCVAAYLVLQLAYTSLLKRVPVADTACIAAGFSLRVAAGAFAAGVAVYPWILACTFVLALFLALGKRRAELFELGPSEAPKHRAALAKCSLRGLDAACTASAVLSVAFYAAWTLAPSTVGKFGTQRLSATIPVVAFAVFKYLRLVLSGRGGARPEKTFMRSPVLLGCVALWLAACAAAWLSARP